MRICTYTWIYLYIKASQNENYFQVYLLLLLINEQILMHETYFYGTKELKPKLKNHKIRA